EPQTETKAYTETQVDNRLRRALRFFWEVQTGNEHWDYGDSDNGSTVPFGLRDSSRVREWRNWAAGDGEAALYYWLRHTPLIPHLGFNPPPYTRPLAGWSIYEDSRIALNACGFWWLRWDLSPLGYLRTAAHGHLD